LVKLSKALYRELRNKMIESMSSDVHSAWQDEGRRFESFRLRLVRKKPREWRLVVFLFRRLGRRFLQRRGRYTRDEKEGKCVDGVTEGAAGGTAENQVQDELDGDRVEVLGSKEQRAQLPGEAPMRPAAKSHNVFQMFAKKYQQRQDSRVEPV
jgi:hypothetical protein